MSQVSKRNVLLEQILTNKLQKSKKVVLFDIDDNIYSYLQSVNNYNNEFMTGVFKHIVKDNQLVKQLVKEILDEHVHHIIDELNEALMEEKETISKYHLMFIKVMTKRVNNCKLLGAVEKARIIEYVKVFQNRDMHKDTELNRLFGIDYKKYDEFDPNLLIDDYETIKMMKELKEKHSMGFISSRGIDEINHTCNLIKYLNTYGLDIKKEDVYCIETNFEEENEYFMTPNHKHEHKEECMKKYDKLTIINDFIKGHYGKNKIYYLLEDSGENLLLIHRNNMKIIEEMRMKISKSKLEDVDKMEELLEEDMNNLIIPILTNNKYHWSNIYKRDENGNIEVDNKIVKRVYFNTKLSSLDLFTKVVHLRSVVTTLEII